MRSANTIKIIILVGVAMGVLVVFYYIGYESGKRDSLSLIQTQSEIQDSLPESSVSNSSLTSSSSSSDVPSPTSPISDIDTSDWKTYRNEEYGFEITFPIRWKDYEVSEKDTVVEFKLKHAIDRKYHTVFTIGIYPKETWEQFQHEESPVTGNYIDEKQGYVFDYSVGHDDEGYKGFPELVPGEIYYGPFYDVETRIMPTFRFINTGGEK